MNKKNIVKEADFEAYGEVRVDSKNRITLGASEMKVSSYKLYRNSLGQYILDPQVAIPAYEAWLFQNDKAKAALQQGLDEAKSGKLIKSNEDFSKFSDRE